MVKDERFQNLEQEKANKRRKVADEAARIAREKAAKREKKG